MNTVRVSHEGQITLEEELLQHLGITQGQTLEILKLPNGELRLRVAHSSYNIQEVFGLLKEKSAKKQATFEEIEEAIQSGWTRQK